MRFRWAYITLCACQFWGCQNPRPVLTHVEPGQGYSDSDLRFTLTGHNFLPATTIDPASGSRVAVLDGFHVRIGKANAWAELTDLAWQSTDQMTATLPSDFANALPDIALDVALYDPRGQSTVLEDAFTELGRDFTSPFAEFTSPAASTPVGPGTLLHVNIHAFDTPPGVLDSLQWIYTENQVERNRSGCPIAKQAGSTDCPFQIIVSQNLKGGELIQISATVTDASTEKNSYTATVQFKVDAPATVTSISPTSGGTAGGTDVVITGSGFIAGTQALIDGVLLFPNGGIVINQTTLSGHVPAHDEGAATIVLSTPLGDSMGSQHFTYVSPPLITTITPNADAPAGGAAVAVTGRGFGADTHIYFGSTLDSAVPLDQLFLQSDTTIIGRAPAGIGQTTVWAFDEALGFTRLPNGFTWRTP
jgi:hypothetical protein